MERARGGLQKIMAEALRQTASEEGPMLAWPLVCGSAVAAKTKALGFKDGVLRVQTQDETWRKQLADFVPAYVAALNELVRERVVRIEFTVAAAHRTH